MDGMAVGSGYLANRSPRTYVYWFFRRYPSVFNQVCYTGTGSARTVAHNLGVVPELMIIKDRGSGTNDWAVYSGVNTKALVLSEVAAYATNPAYWNDTSPTASVFTVAGSGSVNENARSYVAYLFATLAGISKVGTYTGTAALQTVNCGFTTSARWVMIKRTDSTGSWYVWDSARGMSAGNDPYLLFNANVGEVTGTNYVDTDTTGFKITAAAPAEINASGGSYIFLAFA
jgi:hypothetical protein